MIIVLNAKGHECVVSRGTELPETIGVKTEVSSVREFVQQLFKAGDMVYENVGVGEKIELGAPLTWNDLMDLPEAELAQRPLAVMHRVVGG